MGAVELKVDLIQKPVNLLDVIYTASKTCYSAKFPKEIFDSVPDDEKKLSLIRKVVSSGHNYTIEHIQLSFAISNVSRALTHQLVRHRHMSFSQKSQRYVQEKGGFDYIIPKKIENNPELKAKFEEFMQATASLYEEFTSAGIPAEDARAILPNATSTSLVVSMNLRELIHFANLRLCTRAQYEIRMLAKKMCEEVVKAEPWLKEHLVSKCERLGYCDEDKCCGKMPPKAEFLDKK